MVRKKEVPEENLASEEPKPVVEPVKKPAEKLREPLAKGKYYEELFKGGK